MVWLEDPLTGDMPHRGIVEEEDEEQAQELAPQYTAVPAVQVGRGWVAGASAATRLQLVRPLVGVGAAEKLQRITAQHAICASQLTLLQWADGQAAVKDATVVSCRA